MKNNEHDNHGHNSSVIMLILCAAGLTCVEVVVADARSGSAEWPSGSSGDELQTWGKVWGFPLSPRCLPGLP